MIEKIKNKISKFKRDENGDLVAAAWIIGAFVVVVVIILAIKAIAPGTATELWNTIWTWAMDQFGIN